MQEASAAVQLVQNAIHPEAQIIWGLALDDAYGDEVRVTVIAAGFDANAKNDEEGAHSEHHAQHRAEDNSQPIVPPLTPIHTGNAPQANEAAADQTSEHRIVRAADAQSEQQGSAQPKQHDFDSTDDDDSSDSGDLDIPDFLR